MMSMAAEPGSISTSASLLGRAAAGDAVGWHRIVQLYGPLVYSWARRTGLGPHDAADVTQETFAVLATRLPSFDADLPGATFRGWLWTITRNKAADHARRHQHLPRATGGSTNLAMMQALSEPSDSSQPQDRGLVDAASQELERQQIVRRALALMRTHFEPSTWRAFWRTVVDGLSPNEVAQELGVSRWAVYKARARVLQCLRTELDGLEKLDAE